MRSTLTHSLEDRRLPARDPLSHITIHRYRVEPTDLGAAGVVEGGTVLEWIHRAAHATAVRWSGHFCVAASFGHFHLGRPIGIGERVEIHAGLVYTGHSSLHVLVTIHFGTEGVAGTVQTAQCPMIFVAVGDSGEPVAVPPWTPITMLELQRHHQARIRARTRKQIENAISEQTFATTGAAHYTRHVHVSRNDVTRDGTVHGGRVMRWIDQAANVCAAERSGVRGLTSYVAALRFRRSIVVGDHLDVAARVVHTGPRSTHVDVRVTTTDMVTGATHVAADGLIVVVSLDEDGHARPVSQWTPGCDEDVRLDRHARHLVELRQLFAPYTTAPGVPSSFAESGVAGQRGFEEGEF